MMSTLGRSPVSTRVLCSMASRSTVSVTTPGPSKVHQLLTFDTLPVRGKASPRRRVSRVQQRVQAALHNGLTVVCFEFLLAGRLTPLSCSGFQPIDDRAESAVASVGSPSRSGLNPLEPRETTWPSSAEGGSLHGQPQNRAGPWAEQARQALSSTYGSMACATTLTNAPALLERDKTGPSRSCGCR